MERHFLQTVGDHLPPGEIVKLNHQIRIKNHASRNVASGIIDPALGDPQSTASHSRLLPESSPRTGESKPLTTPAEVFQIKAKDVVTLDRVRVLPDKRLAELLQQPAFPVIRRLPNRQQLLAFTKPQPD